MAFISYSIYNKEYINSIDLTTGNRKITKIFTGILNYKNDSNIEFETFNKNDFKYLDINPSINQNGGAEYSYNFWLYFDTGKDDNIIDNTYINSADVSKGDNNKITSYAGYQKYKYIILFYKGEKQRLPLNKNNYDCKYKSIDYDDQIIIKNPLVKIRNDGREIVIDYNNINYPESYNTDAKKLLCNDIDFLEERSKNKFGIKNIDVENYKKKFNMITIIFKEQSNTEQILFNKNANCKIYFNGKLISDRLANVDNIESESINKFTSRVMKSNFSKLHINPTNFGYSFENHRNTDGITELPALQVADLTYYNYSLTQMEVESLYASGFNTYEATFKKRKPKNFTKGKYIKADSFNEQI